MDISDEGPVQPSPRKQRRGPVRPTFARRLKWRVEAAGYVAFEAALSLLPLTWVARVGRVAGHLAYKTLSRRRRVVLRNLRIAFAGEKSDAELRALTAEVFRRTGANLLCAMRTVRLDDVALANVVEIRDGHIVEQAAAKGRGVVVLLAHMGNWEALAQWLPRFVPTGVNAATVYRPLNNPILNARVEEARKRRGLELFSKKDNPLGMAAFLRRGGLLSVLADQRAGEVGELVPFFGRWTSCTPIPAILARRTGAETIGISLRTTSLGRWEMRFHTLREEQPGTANMMELVERMIRVSPADVFWLQDRWKTSARRPHINAGKTARGETSPATKGRRVLLWAGENGVVPVPPEPVPNDARYELALPNHAPTPNEPVVAKLHRYRMEDVERFVDLVDREGSLPLEYVVAHEPSVALRKACKRLSIGLAEAVA